MTKKENIKCEECKWWEPINNDDHGICAINSEGEYERYFDDGCRKGEVSK